MFSNQEVRSSYILAIGLFYFVDFGNPLTVSVEGGRYSLSKEVVEGTNPLLTCQYESDNSSGNKRIEWSYISKLQPKNRTLIVWKKVLNAFVDKFALSEHQASLRILNISRTLAGKYICGVSAPNEVPSSGTGFYNISVVVPPAKPICKYRTLVVPRRSRTGFTCFSNDGIPTPKYAWYRDSVRLPLNRSTNPLTANMSYVYSEVTGTILFSRFTKYDEGKYSCVAFNRVGEKNCSSFYVRSGHDRGQMSHILVAMVSLLYLIINVT